MPQRRRGAPAPAPGRLKGLFADGVWQCDCTPRLPADHFKVKKEGKNQGRWFYTCQKEEKLRCGFFLWQEDALPREQSAVLNNSRHEPRSTPNVHLTRHDFSALNENPKLMRAEITKSPPPPYTETKTSSSITSTLKQESLGRESFYGGGLDDEALASVDTTPLNPTKYAVVSPPPRAAAPTTPSKRKFAEIIDLDADTGLITPQTGGDKSRLKTASCTGDTPSNNVTPTPGRFRDAVSPGTDDDLYTSIQSVLKTNDIVLPTSVKAGIQNVCTKVQLRNQGVAKGREVARLALKAKDARILELEHRVNTLEAELEMQKALVAHLRWEGENQAK